MQFYFIRHGQSANNELYARTNSWEGRSEDPDLTPLGQQQAEALARFLREAGPGSAAGEWDAQNASGFGLTHLYCSLMVRAVATGAVLSQVLGLPLVAWPDAHEVGGIHHKDLETGTSIGLPGRNRAYFEAHYPDLVLPESLGEEGWWNRPFEERDERPVRARRFWGDLLHRHGDRDDRVALVSHGGFYNYLMRVILDLPPGGEVWFSLNNTAITRIDLDEESTQVQYMNRAGFLPPALIT